MESAPDDMQSFKRTQDYEAVRELAVRAGLEVSDEPVEAIVAAFGFYLDGRLMGCAALEHENGHHFLEWVAVDPSVRMRGVGSSLVALVEGEARARGMTELWAKARAPEFYRSIGYRVLGAKEKGPKTLDGCTDCPEFKKSCCPAIVVKDLRSKTR
jgi:N-acetylglutamate synthase-like GNAT family acetyltransferase